ncbi:MAG: hypothetical protein IJ011_09670 [Clostridia bacterium]|nr:hypothetical protein [Clostridia bacterium]
MKKVLSLALALVLIMLIVPIAETGAFAAGGVTLSNSGANAEYSDLNEAINNVENGGTITVKGTYTLPSGFNWTAHGKSVTITGGTFDASGLSVLNIRDNVTFDNVTLKWKGTVCANGNALKVDSDVTVSGTVSAIYGGGGGTTVASTSLTLLSGNYYKIYGGSNKGTVTGDTNVYVGGSANSACDAASHDAIYTVFGGGVSDTVGGNTNLTVADNMKANYIYGGSQGSGAKISGTAYLNAIGGNVMSIYGAGKDVDCVSNTVTTVTGGTFEQIFGGSEGAMVTGNVLLRVWGGTVSRRIYGGCYNEYDLFKWQSSRGVSGNITLVLGSGANITFSSSDDDIAIYAGSRHRKDVDGMTNLVFSDPSATSIKTGAQDGTMAMIMIGVSVYNNKHTLTHKASENVITETCSCGCGHTATATLKLAENASLQYDGQPKTPVTVEYSSGWLGEPLGEITYTNNTDIGTATATAAYTRESQTVTLSFEIWAPVTDAILAIADGKSAATVTLNTNASFLDIPVSGKQLTGIINAVNNGKIITNGYVLTDLSVDISSKEELKAIKNYTRGRFTLTDNIDMSGEELSSTAATLCNSVLDGNGYAIYNYSAVNCGLMNIEGASTVRSLRLGWENNCISVKAEASVDSAAALVGELSAGSSLTLENIDICCVAVGNGDMGAYIGRSFGSISMTDCNSYASITSNEGSAGGYIGSVASAEDTSTVIISGGLTRGEVIGAAYAGGAVGHIGEKTKLTVSDMINTSNVANTGNMPNAYAGAVTSVAMGESEIYVTGAVNLGTVGSATAGSGAIVGYTDTNTLTVKNSVNAGKAENNTDTQIVYGGEPILENNRSVKLKNSSSGTETLEDIDSILAVLNSESNTYASKLGKFMPSTDGTYIVLGTPAVYGVQQGTTEKITVNGAEKEVFSVRFIITVNDTLSYKKLGLRLQANDGKPIDIDSNYVFTTLLATENGGEQTEISAESLGGTYVYAVIVNNIPLEGISSDGSVTLTATPYAVDDAGNEYLGASRDVTYVHGVMQAR